MKRFFSIFVICLLSFNLFSVDLSKVKIGDSKSQVIKQFGTPLKEIKNGKFEYDVWADKKDIWMVSLEDNKVATDPCLLEDLLNTFLDISNAFADLGNSFSDWNVADTSDTSIKVESSTSKKTESTILVDKTLLKSVDITVVECKIFTKIYERTFCRVYNLSSLLNPDILCGKRFFFFYLRGLLVLTCCFLNILRDIYQNRTRST